MQSVRLMQWVSILLAFSILGMGGAPIAEKFELIWLMELLKWMAWISVGFLSIAALFMGGLGIHHGILVVLGKEVGTINPKAPLPPPPGFEQQGTTKTEI
jgi:hypothetical protein